MWNVRGGGGREGKDGGREGKDRGMEGKDEGTEGGWWGELVDLRVCKK